MESKKTFMVPQTQTMCSLTCWVSRLAHQLNVTMLYNIIVKHQQILNQAIDLTGDPATLKYSGRLDNSLFT